MFNPVKILSVLTATVLVYVVWGSVLAEADENNATFEIAVDITWSAATAPFEFPHDGHMSGLIGATHNHRYVLFLDGDTASSGLELVAENGRAATLKAELAEAKRRRRIGSVIAGPKLGKVPGSFTTTFMATKQHPLLSFVAMIAPSPDWFTGVAGVALMDDGEWIDSKQVVLWAWDSGTDAGRTYQAEDVDIQPQQSVRLLASRHFLTERGMVSMGSVTIRRITLQ